MNFSTRELVRLSIYGALWGVVEISLGAFLKTLNIPMSGAVLAAIGLMVAMVGRKFVPKRGSVLFIGVIASLLKLFSFGGVIMGPMIGIISEALIAEISLSLMGKPSPLSFIITGIMGVFWTLVQPLLTGPLLYGRSIFVVWLDLLDRGSRLLYLPANAVLWVLLGLIVLHILLGITSGWLAWNTGLRIEKRVGILNS